MFWRFGGYSNISTIDTLLDKQDVTLEELLDESDLIQELKSHNTKLIEFLRDENTLSRLLKYVIAPSQPSSDDEDEMDDDGDKGKRPSSKIDHDARKRKDEQEKVEKQRLKYSYVACEILSCETWSITEALMSNVPHLTDFWDFLRQSPPLDPLQAGYFTKVNETLLEKKTEDMLDFFKSLPGIVPAILQHVDCPMVMDLLLKIISLEKQEGGAGVVDWLHSQDLIPTLLSNLSPECNSSTQTSAGDFLKAIITISANAAQNEQSCIGPNSLTRQLVSESCMHSLIMSMLQGGNPLTVGVGIVIEVIRKNNSDYDPENGHNPDAPPTSHDPIYLGTLLRMFAKHVPDFMRLILSSKHTVTEGETTKTVERGKLNSAWGTKIEPLGFDRFKTCELMAELLHCSNMGLLNEKGSEEYMKERDAERERLREQGALTSHKAADDSAVDLSIASSTFQTSMADFGEGLHIANTAGSEEDGFEKVAVMDATDDADIRLQLEHVNQARDQSIEMLDPANIALPMSPSATRMLSPTTTNLDDQVRRLSIEDTDMTEADDPSSQAIIKDSATDDAAMHADIRPAPLFSRPPESDKTPTPSSPTATRRTIDLERSESNDTSLVDVSNVSPTQTHEIHHVPESPVVGDYLKMTFVDNKVVPTILDFFFRFPWNNFLHNVVYDVVQQVFNGPMERTHNRYLAFDLFDTGKITERIIQGQKDSDEAQEQKNMRLGYMGHLTLVAEEVVKFGERHDRDLLTPSVREYIYGSDWEHYVTKTLTETRDRDNAILGGVRPESGMAPRQAVLNAVNASQGFSASTALANAGLNGGQAGLDSIDLSNNGSATSAGFGSNANSLVSDFGNSSDDDDEEMDDSDDEHHRHLTAIQLSAADTGISLEGDQPVPLIPPPPAPLNIPPSRARQRLANLLMQRQQAEEQEQEAAASEFGVEGDDAFASLGDDDDGNTHDATNPFALGEEEQDITAFGVRNKAPTHHESSSNGGEPHGFSVTRGLSSLFTNTHPNTSTGHARQHEGPDDFDQRLDEESSSSSSSDDSNEEHGPLEARTSHERKPLDVDDDEDDEMGEMVAPESEHHLEPNSSDEDDVDEGEVLSLVEREKLRGIGVGTRSSFGHEQEDEEESVSEFDGQGDNERRGEEDDGDGEGGLVEIAMPVSSRSSRRSDDQERERERGRRVVGAV